MPPQAWALASMWSEVFEAPRFRGRGRVQKTGFRHEALAPLLRLAASGVAALAPHVPGQDHTSVVPPHGASRELLVAAMDGDPKGAVLSDPTGNPSKFVRELVKSAFMTGDGELLQGLAETKLEELIDAHCGRQLELAEELVKDPTGNLRAAFETAKSSVEKLLAMPPEAGDLAGADSRLALTQRLLRIAEDASAILSGNTEELNSEEESGAETQEAQPGTSDADTSSATEGPDQPPLKRTKSQIAVSLKVQKVQKHTEELCRPVYELARSVSSMAKHEVPVAPIESLQTEIAAVEQARKRANHFGEDLIEDMVLLDSLSSLTQEDRESRKATLASIESLLQDVDAAKSKLAAIHRKLEDKLKLQAAQAAQAAEAASGPEQETVPSARATVNAKGTADACWNITATPGKDVWQKVRLPLRFHSREERNLYSISATCPGLSLEDLKLELSDDGSTLTVSGIRAPSEQEAESMRKRISQKLRAIAQKSPKRMAELKKFLPQVISDGYIELAQGEYGRFSETFQVPDGVKVDGIEASYREGVLRIALPKLEQPARFAASHPPGGRYVGGRSAHPYDARGQVNPGRSSAMPWGGALFGGNDDFFRW